MQRVQPLFGVCKELVASLPVSAISEVERLKDGTVSLNIGGLQVIQLATTFTYKRSNARCVP